MKNKKLLYILFPAVLFIWGYIFYEIFGSKGNSNGDDMNLNDFSKTEHVSSLPDTFSIHPDYRDPFLEESIHKNEGSVKYHSVGLANNSKQVKAETNTTVWPVIIYTGIIKNQKSSKQLVMIQISGQSIIMAKGEKSGMIELTKISKDFIEMQFGKEKKVFNKS
jgi:hypothetical protein